MATAALDVDAARGNLSIESSADYPTRPCLDDRAPRPGFREAMEEELTKAVVKRLGIQLDTLLYDTTNFFTFIASTNTRSKLTSRGHNKQKRHHQEPCASETAVCVYRRNGLDPAYLLAQRPTNPAVRVNSR